MKSQLVNEMIDWSTSDWISVGQNNWAFDPPLFDSTSYALPSVESWESFLSGTSEAWCYSSDSHPSGFQLSRILADTQKRSDCVLTSTGKSAIAQTLLSLLSSKDEIIILKEAYKSTRFFAEKILQNYNIKTHVVSVDDDEIISELLERPEVKILMLESPTNPQCRVPNIKKFCTRAHNQNALVILDNSMAGFHQHGDLPIDIFVHSLSKFASASADVMGGAIIANKDILQKMRSGYQWATDVLDPRAAHNILKGLQTYQLRRERQSSSALQIAQALEKEPFVESILYPGLKSHPDYRYATEQMKDFGVIISFNYAGDESETKAFINRLKKFKIAFGSAYPTSIVSPGFIFYGRSFPENEIKNYGIKKNTVRLSIGLESPELLLNDLINTF